MTEDSAILEIIALREAWLAAVRNADADRLASLVTDDVVIVQGDGRCVRGSNEVSADFRKGFESWSINQQVVDPEIAIRGNWAFENRQGRKHAYTYSRRRGDSYGHNGAGCAAQATESNLEGGKGCWTAGLTS